ncbi:hypothetical protein K474DRAFT_668024 [Panus rudis PR-1116 ss-1]|nr:hypothetical protein K474DRAFT_668024 [Panus rudis PR-1116 ss-1]
MKELDSLEKHTRSFMLSSTFLFSIQFGSILPRPVGHMQMKTHFSYICVVCPLFALSFSVPINCLTSKTRSQRPLFFILQGAGVRISPFPRRGKENNSRSLAT